MQGWLVDLNSRLVGDQSSDQLEKEHRALVEATEKLALRDEEVRHLHRVNDGLRHRLDELQANKSEASQLENEVRGLVEANTKLKAEYNSEVRGLVEANTKLKAEYNSKICDLREDYTREIQCLESKLGIYTSENGELQQELQVLYADRAAAKKEIISLQDRHRESHRVMELQHSEKVGELKRKLSLSAEHNIKLEEKCKMIRKQLRTACGESLGGITHLNLSNRPAQLINSSLPNITKHPALNPGLSLNKQLLIERELNVALKELEST